MRRSDFRNVFLSSRGGKVPNTYGLVCTCAGYMPAVRVPVNSVADNTMCGNLHLGCLQVAHIPPLDPAAIGTKGKVNAFGGRPFDITNTVCLARVLVFTLQRFSMPHLSHCKDVRHTGSTQADGNRSHLPSHNLTVPSWLPERSKFPRWGLKVTLWTWRKCSCNCAA